MAEQTVEAELEPSESRVVSFEAIPHEARTYSVSVDGLYGSFKALLAPVSLSGIVTNAITGSPIAGVRVYFDGQETYTDASGAYRISRLVVGEIHVAFIHTDYEAYYIEITLSLGDNKLDAALTPVTTGEIALVKGYNLVTYSGKLQSAAEAFASIVDYIAAVQWYRENVWYGSVNPRSTTFMMFLGDNFWIYVNRDCLWRF